MVRFRKNYGFIISLLVHMLIISIPVSMSLSRHYKEVELFIIEDNPIYPTPEEVFEQPVKKEAKPKVPLDVKRPEKPIVKKKNKSEPLPKQPEETNFTEPTMVSDDASQSLPIAIPISEPIEVASVQSSLLDIPFGSENGPRFLKKEMPQYPIMARRLGKEGKVLLRLTIDENGELLDLEVLEGAPYGFTEAAVEAVKKSRFAPATKDGKPVLSKAILPITFKLKGE